MDPRVPPDPERWLPMRQRASHKQRKGGKGKFKVSRGHQGAAVPEKDAKTEQPPKKQEPKGSPNKPEAKTSPPLRAANRKQASTKPRNVGKKKRNRK